MSAIAVQSSFSFEIPKRRNVVIEAGAGTGKTTAIVAEVLKLLLGDEALSPERIVLVTFTEKAAGEIADRIHQALTELELRFDAGQEASWPIDSATPLFEVPAGKRDDYRRACAAQIARIESLRSQTIHSFCQSLLRQFPIEAGLDPQFTIIEGFERSLLYGELYDAWVDQETRLHPTPEIRRDWEVLLEHVGYLFLVRNIILPLLDRRDLLLDDTYDLGSLELVEHELLIAIERLRVCDAGSVSTICDYLRDHQSPRRGSDIDAWLAYLRPIANAIRTSDLPKGKAAQFNDAVRVLRADQNKGNSVYDRLSSHRAAVSLLAMMRRFMGFLEDEKRKRGVVDFDDLLLRTLAVLDDETVVERVRGQFDFIFVDEFQDTDRVQARIIDRLARDRGGSLIDGRTTIVGDPKQSIYGFRRADPETYDAFTRELIASGAEHRKLLDQFRSEPRLLDAVNALFTDLFEVDAHDPNVFRPEYHRLQASKSETSALDASITIIDAPFGHRDDRFTAEAESIAAWIKARGGDLRRYALLFRRTTKLDDYLDVFERRGIDYVLPPTRLFLDRPAPVDLLAVLRAIAFPFDLGAEISAARTPYFALTDAEIARGVLGVGDEPTCHPEPPKPRQGLRTVEGPPDEQQRFEGDREQSFKEGGPSTVLSPSGASAAQDDSAYCRDPYSAALTDAEIARGVIQGDSKKLPSTTLNIESPSPPRLSAGEKVPKADEGVYQTFLQTLSSLRAAAQHLTVAQLIDLVIRTCGIEVVYAAAADGTRSLRHLEHVRAIAFAYDQRIGGSVRQFVDEITRRRMDPDEMEPSLIDEAGDAVRILTIHAAKGLEFDTVIIPDLEFQVKSPDIFLVDEPRSIVLRGQVETLSAHYGRAGQVVLKDIGKMREEAENWRLFYVAVTRAKTEVVFVTNAKPRKEGFATYVEELFALPTAPWPEEHGRVIKTMTIGGDAVPMAFERVATEGTGTRTRRRLIDPALEAELAALPIVEPSIPMLATLPETLTRGDVLTRRASSQKRGAGILLHRVLELWDGQSPVETLLTSLAIEQGVDATTIALVRKRLAKVSKSKTFLRITSAETLGRELPLLTPNGERRIDRFLREDGKDLVVDYKSGQPSEQRIARDTEQVASYCQSMSAITGRACGGLLWYIDVDVDLPVSVD